jgi:hypothetical protein
MDCCPVAYQLDYHARTGMAKAVGTAGRPERKGEERRLKLAAVRRQDVTGCSLWEMDLRSQSRSEGVHMRFVGAGVVRVHCCFGEIQDRDFAVESESVSLVACRVLDAVRFPCYLLSVEVSLMVLRDWFDIQDC